MEPHESERKLPSLQPEGIDVQKSDETQSPNLERGGEQQSAQPLEQLRDNRSFEREQQSAAKLGATTLPMPQISSDDSATVTPLPDLMTPSAAHDDDVMEKEWVTKSKKVVETTKGDPYNREKEVSKLQADYIQKRYGKQIKIPEDV